MSSENGSRTIQFEYTNHEGKTAIRRAIPQSLNFDSNHYHTTPQWLLHCWDLDRKAHRTFALTEMKFINE